MFLVVKSVCIFLILIFKLLCNLIGIVECILWDGNDMSLFGVFDEFEYDCND